MGNHVPPALFTGFPDYLTVALETFCTLPGFKFHDTPVSFEDMEIESTEFRRLLYHPLELFTFEQWTESAHPDRQFRSFFYLGNNSVMYTLVRVCHFTENSGPANIDHMEFLPWLETHHILHMVCVGIGSVHFAGTQFRSEERRVGNECRSRIAPDVFRKRGGKWV